MSLIGAGTYKNADGSTTEVEDTDTGQTFKNYGADGKMIWMSDVSYDEAGVKTNLQYGSDYAYKGKVVTSADGKSHYYDKNGKEKYDTGEGETDQAPTLEEFLRVKNSGGGYTDGRPELQSDVPMEKDPAKARNFGVIDVNPDYTEATAGADGTPGRTIGGNIAAPETVREELQAPKPEMPPTPGGNPTSDGSN